MIAGLLIAGMLAFPGGMPSDVIELYKLRQEEEIVMEVYMGNYELTAYIETGSPCADGVYPTVCHTVASNDPSLWHKWIRIEGYGEYYVHDRGGMASNVIDIYMGSFDEAIQFGRRTADIYVIGE